ncbi:GAS2-like protein pickled eggs [Hetaerina americana]|uniref:GAS2-like protein pickled eggs n=1 Tax=Hetaerina americana TaxID=62018 RepID=UPI003A7F25D0
MKEDLAEWLNGLYPGLDITANDFMEKLDTGVVLCKHANNVREAAEEWVARRQARRMQLSGMTASATVTNGGGLNGCRIGGVAYRPDVKPGTFFARDNVSNFIAWCRHQLGVLECLLFETDDLILRKNTRHVVLCLLEVARRGARFGMPAPLLVQFEREIEREIAAETRTMLKRRGSTRRRLVLNSGEEADCEEEEEEEEEDEEEDYLVQCGPMPQIVTNDLKSLDEMVRELVERCSCPTQFPMVRVSEGKYRIGDTKVLIFVRILRKHVMVRVGGGWDTLSHYLDKHDPCRCRTAHRSALSSRLVLRNTPAIELGSAIVHYDRSPASPPRTRRSSTSSVGSGVGGSAGGLSPCVGQPGSGRRSLAGPEAERGRDEGRDVRAKRSRSRSPYHLHAGGGQGVSPAGPTSMADSRRSPARRSPARNVVVPSVPIREKTPEPTPRIMAVPQPPPPPGTTIPATTQVASCDSSGDEGYRSLQGPRRSGEEEEEEEVVTKGGRHAADETDGRPDSRLATASSSDCSSTLSAEDSSVAQRTVAVPAPHPTPKRSPAVEKRTVRHTDVVTAHHPEGSPRRHHRPTPPSAAPRSPCTTALRMTRSRSAGGDAGLAAAERHVMVNRSVRLRSSERPEDDLNNGKNTWGGRSGPRSRPAITADTFRRPGAGSSSPPAPTPRRSLPASLACGSQSAPPRRRAWNSGQQQQQQNYGSVRGLNLDQRRHKGSLPASLQPSPTRAPEVAPILEQMLRDTTAAGEEDAKVLRHMRELIRRYAAIVEGKLAEGGDAAGGPKEGAPGRTLAPSPRKDSKPGSRIPAPTFYGAPCS